MMKVCPKCGKEKDATAFDKRQLSKDGLQAWCKSCQLLQQKAWRKENPEKAKALQARSYKKLGPVHQTKWRAENPERAREVSRNAKQRVREYIQQYKSAKGCEHCGITDFRVLDLHHRNGADKIFAVSQMISKYGFDTVKKEIEKCYVLCANCHRIEHFEKIHL